MKKIFLFIALFTLFVSQNCLAQLQKHDNTRKNEFPSNIYYGGGIGLSFTSSYFSVSLRPMLGFKLSPKMSLGLEVMYEYVKDARYSKTYNYSNYGGSLFARYRVIPALYLQAEYATYNYEYRTALNETREWVPFLLLGVGYSQRIGRRTYAYAQVLWDVLQDERSPYNPGEPWITFGVSSGF